MFRALESNGGCFQDNQASYPRMILATSQNSSVRQINQAPKNTAQKPRPCMALPYCIRRRSISFWASLSPCNACKSSLAIFLPGWL